MTVLSRFFGEGFRVFFLSAGLFALLAVGLWSLWLVSPFDMPTAVPVAPGPRHWEVFTDLVQRAGCRGGLVSDAYHAAVAIEHGCEWITTDRDYARFPGLRWRHPLDERQ